MSPPDSPSLHTESFDAPLSSVQVGVDLVLFGGTGDLAMRKLLPALYYCCREGEEMHEGRIIAVAREALSREAYLQRVESWVRDSIPAADYRPDSWQALARRIEFVSLNALQAADYAALADCLGARPEVLRVYYLATGPDLFVPICEQLKAAGLVGPRARVVLEKPLGRDLLSARRINAQVGAIFEESQIYRIDHYLGKETVQNLLALRFGNSLLEPLWRREWVRDVQITIAEQVGVEGRGEFYDRTGALRDMVQNHLLQLLCMLAMEPPSSLDPDAVRDEKLKVLRSLRPIVDRDVATHIVRGQYRAGAISGQAVPGYVEELGGRDSRTETYVAMKLGIDNWRWSGVPFHLRTGKRMQERIAQIVVNFRPQPHRLMESAIPGLQSANRLLIRLQPDEGLALHLLAKTPGDEMCLVPVELGLDFRQSFTTRRRDAYERLLREVMRGRAMLFMRRDELDAAWRWIEPILQAWESGEDRPRPYAAGTWGPVAASTMLGRDGLAWHEEV